MEREDTKQRILEAALNLFSQEGYDSVSMEQIAQAVGIKAPSLYKHYKGKQDIFNAVLQEMERRYQQQTEALEMHPGDVEKDTAMFSKVTEDDLVRMVRTMVWYSLDESVRKFRKLLTVEQFRQEGFAELYTERYLESMMDYHTRLFRRLVQQGVLEDEDPEIMALQYVSPVCVLLALCDRQPEREQEAMKILERHIRQFHQRYRKKG